MKDDDTLRDAEAPASPDGYHTSEATSRSKRVELEFTSKRGGVLKKYNSTGSVSPKYRKVRRAFSALPAFAWVFYHLPGIR